MGTKRSDRPLGPGPGRCFLELAEASSAHWVEGETAARRHTSADARASRIAPSSTTYFPPPWLSYLAFNMLGLYFTLRTGNHATCFKNKKKLKAIDEKSSSTCLPSAQFPSPTPLPPGKHLCCLFVLQPRMLLWLPRLSDKMLIMLIEPHRLELSAAGGM